MFKISIPFTVTHEEELTLLCHFLTEDALAIVDDNGSFYDNG